MKHRIPFAHQTTFPVTVAVWALALSLAFVFPRCAGYRHTHQSTPGTVPPAVEVGR